MNICTQTLKANRNRSEEQIDSSDRVDTCLCLDIVDKSVQFNAKLIKYKVETNHAEVVKTGAGIRKYYQNAYI